MDRSRLVALALTLSLAAALSRAKSSACAFVHPSFPPLLQPNLSLRRRQMRRCPSSLGALSGSTISMYTEDDGSRESGRVLRKMLDSCGSLSPPKLTLGRFPVTGGRTEAGGGGSSTEERRRANERNVRGSEETYGMPWTESCRPGEGHAEPGSMLMPRTYRRRSIEGHLLGTDVVDGDEAASSPLLFMPFWEWQMSFMKSELTDLRPLPTESTFPAHGGPVDVALAHSPTQNARVVNLAYSSSEYRKIRMTYYDAGDSIQVFNSLWYPHPRYDLPVLGIDLLAFGRKKYLTVVDYQPIHSSEEDHAAPYEEVLGPIRDAYPSLQGSMSDRFYDSSRHFSSSTLFGRLESERSIGEEVHPAFRSAVGGHLSLLRRSPPDDTLGGMERTLRGQARYDSYSAARDPAHGLFKRVFGEEWADAYVYGFLFDLSGGPPTEEEEEEWP